jgi:hypothetical protein
MTLDPGAFIRRFLLHVLPKGFHRIRHAACPGPDPGDSSPAPPARPVSPGPASCSTLQRHTPHQMRRASPTRPHPPTAASHARTAAGAWSSSRSSSVAPNPVPRQEAAPGSGPNRHDLHRRAAAADNRRAPPTATGRLCAPQPETPHQGRARARIGPPVCVRPLRTARPVPHSNPQTGTKRRIGLPDATELPGRTQQKPIAPKIAPSPRGFLPWRLSDAGPNTAPTIGRVAQPPASETLHRRWYIAAAVPHDHRMSTAPSRMIVKSGSP